MPQSLSAIYLHVIFSTKNREPWLTEIVAQRVYDYIGATLKTNGCALLAAGGIADHVHLLVSLSREMSTAALVRLVKSTSSRWIHDTFAELRGFSWQTGYGVFSVSHSRLNAVRAYIANQQTHHAKHTFQQELTAFLARHELTWEEEYLWE